jgi:PAS domain S-box-containing protein
VPVFPGYQSRTVHASPWLGRRGSVSGCFVNVLRSLFGPGNFMPHGYCYLWNPELVWLNVIADSLVAFSYFTIPFALFWFVRKRRDLPFSSVFVLFGVFIVACGATHAMEVWNLWHAQYWLAAAIKAVTAIASIGTALVLTRLLPKAVGLPGVAQWSAANALLETEIKERRELEVSLRSSAASFREQSEMLELIHDAIFVRNLHDEIVFWSGSAERLYGWKKDEVKGRTARDLLREEFPCERPLIEAIVLEKGYWEGEVKHHTRSGGTVIVSSRWALRRGERGEAIGVLESNRDITKLKYEERRFQNLLEAAPDAIVIVDGEGIIQVVNAETERMFGYTRGELVGQPVEILIPHNVPSQHSAYGLAYSDRPEPRAMGPGLNLHGRRKDGTQFPVEIRLSPLEGAGGKLVSSSIRDVSERKNFEMKLRESEQRFRLLVEGVKDYAIVGLDATGVVSTWNAGAERIKGYTAEEVIGRHFSCFYPPADVDAHVPSGMLRQAARDGMIEQEGWRVRKDGTQFWANVVLSALHDDFGKLIGFAKITRDVSERCRLEHDLHEGRELLEQRVSARTLELANANMDLRLSQNEISALNASLEQRVEERTAELVRTNSELESFSYSVSHDLRAPVRHIDGFARILQEEFGAELPKEAQLYLDRILHAATHMGHLVDDLLNLAQIGRKELVREPVETNELVKQAITEVVSEKDRIIEWRIDNLPVSNCDAGLMKLVFINLLSNAVKFTRKCSPAMIQVGAFQSGGIVTIFVRDNGVGFDPQYADKLFGVFQRLHRQEDFEGTGVGLATVQKIIHRHGGRIWAESEPNRGATFFFTLGSQSQAIDAHRLVGIEHA